jgi:hypothetical protein
MERFFFLVFFGDADASPCYELKTRSEPKTKPYPKLNHTPH